MEVRRAEGGRMSMRGLEEEGRREEDVGRAARVQMVKSAAGDGVQRNGQGERHLRPPCRQQQPAQESRRDRQRW